MKNIFKIFSKTTAIMILSVVAISTTEAQPGPGGPGAVGNTQGVQSDGTGATASPGQGTSVPFDGGMSLMLAASGIGYASKKLKRKK